MLYSFKILLFALSVSSISAQAQTFDRLIRPMATVADRETIEMILNELLILVPDSLTTMNLVDVTANGYGVDDLIILNPSGQVHHLSTYIPAALQELVATWSFEADYRYEGLQNETPMILLSAHRGEEASDAIAGTCVDAVAQHYSGGNMNLLISQDHETVRLEMWGYDPQALQYGGAGETIACEIDRQKFEFAPPIVVTAFRDGDTCVETWGSEGQIHTRPCDN
ncbi:MAG: hypothetical protein F4Z16_06445 [Rhodothermaceae bacterium]|nr:hypothetical protein [Rhodothermaceae bacterium]